MSSNDSDRNLQLIHLAWGLYLSQRKIEQLWVLKKIKASLMIGYLSQIWCRGLHLEGLLLLFLACCQGLLLLFLALSQGLHCKRPLVFLVLISILTIFPNLLILWILFTDLFSIVVLWENLVFLSTSFTF